MISQVSASRSPPLSAAVGSLGIAAFVARTSFACRRVQFVSGKSMAEFVPDLVSWVIDARGCVLTEPLHPKAHGVVCASILLQSLPAVNHAGVLSRLAARGGNEVEKTRQDLGFSSFAESRKVGAKVSRLEYARPAHPPAHANDGHAAPWRLLIVFGLEPWEAAGGIDRTWSPRSRSRYPRNEPTNARRFHFSGPFQGAERAICDTAAACLGCTPVFQTPPVHGSLAQDRDRR